MILQDNCVAFKMSMDPITIDLSSLKHDIYEVEKNVTVVFYIKNVSSFKSSVTENTITIEFSTSDAKFLEERGGSGDSVFVASSPLNGTVEPDSAAQSVKKMKVEIRMKKANLKKWETLAPKRESWTQIDQQPKLFEFTAEPGVKETPSFHRVEAIDKGDVPVKVQIADDSSIMSDWDSEECDSDEDFDEQMYQYLLKDETFPYLKLFLTDQLIDYLVTKTNETAEKKVEEVNEGRETKLVWKPITVREMWVFLGLVYGSATHHVQPSKYMDRKRFKTILALLTLGESSTSKSMKKIEPVFDMICSRFASVYKPKRELVLCEAVIPWVPDDKEMTFLAMNRHKFSVKVHVLCESESGYTCGVLPWYKEEKTINTVIPELLKNHLQQGYRIYLIRCPFDLSLVKKLYEKKTHISAKIKLHGHTPEIFSKAKSEVKKNNPTFVRHDETLVMFCPEMADSKAMTLVSSMHDASCVDHEAKWTEYMFDRRTERVRAPKLQLDWEKFVYRPRLDVLINSYLPLRGMELSVTKRLFVTLLQNAMINAYIIYKKRTEVEAVKYRHFIRAVVISILKEFSEKRRRKEEDGKNIYNCKEKSDIREDLFSRDRSLYDQPDFDGLSSGDDFGENSSDGQGDSSDSD